MRWYGWWYRYEQVICTKTWRHKYNKFKSLAQSKKKLIATMSKKIELQIMDRGDASIEKDAKQFLVEGSEIKKKDCPYTSDNNISIRKNIPTNLLHSFDQSRHHNYNQREEDD